jgi:glyoxylase-like metal-dependent hydrolase (beta-lactamase superfamily II)
MSFKPFLLKVEMAIGEVNTFVFGCDETKEAVLIDAGKFEPSVVEYVRAEGLNVSTIFLTHDHGDHVAGVAECAKEFGAKVIAGTEKPGGYTVDTVVGHGDEVKVGNLVGRVVSTPGHTPVGLSLIFPGMVFSGDALFAGSVGGTKSDEDYAMQIEAVRDYLLTLPVDTQIHSGHGPATTVSIEKRYNPFFVE